MKFVLMEPVLNALMENQKIALTNLESVKEAKKYVKIMNGRIVIMLLMLLKHIRQLKQPVMTGWTMIVTA